jgi:hypothetical protein
VKEKRGAKLHDSKPLGNKSHLTQPAIDRLQNYYGLAIRTKANNLEVMKRAMWALLFHKLLTNEKPQHGVCASGGDNWCKFNNGASSGVAYELKHYLRAGVMDSIKVVFRDLAGVDPLKKCFDTKNHNRNGHVNSVIWTRISKTVFVRLDTLKIGVCDVLNILGVRSGSNH